MHVAGKTDHLSWMLSFLEAKFFTQLFIPASDDQRVKMSFYLVELIKDFTHGAHAEPPCEDEQCRHIIAQPVGAANGEQVKILGKAGRNWNTGNGDLILRHPACNEAPLG